MTLNQSTSNHSRKYILLAIKGMLSVGLLVLLLSNFSLEDTLFKLGKDAIPMVALAIAVLISGLLIGAYRWWDINRITGPSLGFMACFRLTLIGHFFNQILPSSIGGDVVRTWGAYKMGLTLGHATTSALLDRLVGLVGLLALILAGIPLLATRTSDPYILIVLGLIFVGATGGLIALASLDRMTFLTQRWATFARLATFSLQLRNLVKKPFRLATLIIASLIVHMMVLMLGQFFAEAMGVHLSLADAIGATNRRSSYCCASFDAAAANKGPRR